MNLMKESHNDRIYIRHIDLSASVVIFLSTHIHTLGDVLLGKGFHKILNN